MNKYNEVAITLYYENEAPPTENLSKAWLDGRDLMNSQLTGTITHEEHGTLLLCELNK